ncbi:MAG: 2-oxoacid:acceptor oxidoreductase family protein [Sandaracinaceae bacterium]|nr:2-oxoacid:acceptor oxidoreductase family protein [Sandaracinaceae bacterium]
MALGQDGARLHRSPGARSAILLAGVGGQGVLTAARVLGEAAHAAGLEVVVGQLHGMAQRGGTVECSVRIGVGEGSLLTGAPDLVVAFEPLELLRALRPRPGVARALVSDTAIVPHRLAGGGAGYPAMQAIVAEAARACGEVRLFPGREITEELREGRVLNTAMLGAIGGMGALPFDARLLGEAASRRLPARFVGVNERAFELGRAWAAREVRA